MPRLLLLLFLLGVGSDGAIAQPITRTEAGTLEAGDDQLDGGEFYDVFSIAVAEGETVEADLTSDAFDPFLILIAPDGNSTQNDDYEGSRQRSFLQQPAPQGGVYQVVVTSYAAEETGPYRLVLTTRGAGTRASAPSLRTAAPDRASWDGPDRFDVGDAVLYRVGPHWWKQGEVLATPRPRGASTSEHTYLIREQSGGQNYYDYEQVTSLGRQPYWTNWFVGDWDLSIFVAGMATNDAGEVGVYRDGVLLPPLQIRADGTYTWVIDGDHGPDVLEGTWSSNPDGPGVVLHDGDYGNDWKVYNWGDAASRSIIERDQIRLTDDAGGSRIGHRR